MNILPNKQNSASSFLPKILLLLALVLILAGSVNAYDITQAYNSNLNFSLSTLTKPTDIFVNPDLNKFYIIDDTLNDRVYQYNASIANNVSSLVYSELCAINAHQSTAQSLFFSTDGTKMFISGAGNPQIALYSLSTAWKLSTCSYVSKSSSLVSSYVYGFSYVTPTMLYYVDGLTPDKIYRYTTATNYSTTLTKQADEFSVATYDSIVSGLFVLPNENKLYLTGISTDDVYQFDIININNVSTLNYTGKFDTTLSHNPEGLFISEDGGSMFIVSSADKTIRQYYMSTINYPPNPAENIKPSNITITLNSTGVTIPINWTGGDDNNSDVVTAQVYLRILGNYEFIQNTTSQSASMTLDNSYLSSSYYQIYLNLTDGLNETISQGDYFELCVNDWTAYNSTCESNLQTLLYTDDNSCPLQYDLPSNNGTVSACDVGSSGAVSVTIENPLTTELLIFFLILALSIISIFAIDAMFIPISATVILFGLIFIVSPLVTSNSLQILTIFFAVVAFFASLWAYFEGKDKH